MLVKWGHVKKKRGGWHVFEPLRVAGAGAGAGDRNSASDITTVPKSAFFSTPPGFC